MTTAQKITTQQIEVLISKFNNKVVFGSVNVRKGHISFTAIRKRTSSVCDTIEIFCSIDVNTKGNIVSGKWNKLAPIEIKKTFFHI